MRRVLRPSALLVLGASLLLGTAVAHAAAPPEPAPAAVEPGLQQQILDARPLDDVRSGPSEQEPEYCAAEVVRETNPAAANRSSVEIGPPKFLVEGLEPGSTWRHCLSVYNRSPDPRSVQLSTLDVVGSLDPDVRIETRPSPAGVGSWITFGLERIDLQPGERVLVPYLLDVPDDPPGGTLTAGLAVEDLSRPEGDLGGARVTRSLVAQLQVTFPGGVARPLEVEVDRADRLVWTGRDPDRVTTTYTLSNIGEVVDTAEVEYVVDGLFGRKVVTIPMTPEVLVPRSAQEFRVDWRNLPWIGTYQPTLRLSSTAGNREVDLPRVWILPPWPVIAAFVLALVMLGWGLLRRRRAWQAYLDDEDDEGLDDEGAYEDGFGPRA